MERGDAPPDRPVPVWDRAVRSLHWLLAGAVAWAWISTLTGFQAHEAAGYVALAVLAARTAWGFVGSPPARFGRFVRRPRDTLAYVAQLRAGHEPRYLGHNPLGAWMVLALLACVAGTALTGWLYTTDAFWGMAWLEQLHRLLAWLLLGLIALHVTGVLVTSRRHRENLVRAMIDGRKPPPQQGDIAP